MAYFILSSKVEIFVEEREDEVLNLGEDWEDYYAQRAAKKRHFGTFNY